ncbi:chitobiase/beta-hexosaminidase C-terminal domain-containing protein [Isoptericola halotolerans]|uniref:OmpL47-type beta-barrel domain-containing protein n=1 Tax=Isoptericola halotolerans TaxID=300560 RepID=UPI003890BDC6
MNPPDLARERRPGRAAGRRGRLLAGAATGALVAMTLVPGSATAAENSAATAAPERSATQQSTQQSTQLADQLAEQVLTFTANNSVTEYSSAPATATAGTATIVFDNSLDAGNTIGMSHTLTFDTTTPGYNHDVSLDILANPFDANGGRHEAEVTLTPGTYRYFCAIPGHGTMVGELVVTGGGDEDTTAPTVTADVTGEQDVDGGYIESAMVALAAEDAGSGVASVEYDLDGAGWTDYTAPFDVTTTGEHTVAYRATDEAGNTSEAGSATFTVVEATAEDTVPPVVTPQVVGEPDGDGGYVGSATVTLAATDDASGVESVEYDLDGAGYVDYTEPVVLSEPGMHMLSYRATDGAGNTSQSQMLHVTVVAPDTTAPTVTAEVTGEQDADGAYLGSAAVTLTATDEESGVESVEYDLDGAGWTTYDAPVVLDQVGEHTLGYRATDAAGNTSEAGTVSVTVVEDDEPTDTTPPEVSAEATGEQDADGAYLGSATVTVTATDDDSGVATVEYALDDEAFATYESPVTVSDPGSHTVRFRAVDTAGNTSDEGAVSFLVARDGTDACPASDERPTVVVGDIVTQVANVDVGNGCTINDLIDSEADYANHGAFVTHVRETADDLVADGHVAKKDRSELIRSAARSDVGK